MADKNELKEYRVAVGNRRGTTETTMRLNARDAETMGLTDADLVGARKPAAKAQAAPTNKARAPRGNKGDGSGAAAVPAGE